MRIEKGGLFSKQKYKGFLNVAINLFSLLLSNSYSFYLYKWISIRYTITYNAPYFSAKLFLKQRL